ncbi:hypothetical protein [Pararhodospirillum oryzae]|uniref:Uncharacterized protein n=1 Tax=Pararhodospirillum oryzae TaxID=478448 RepID=A0A512H979_9PROT|nr:hypothetical protein [Pararhodospirillum oryzae]GEO82016.1 hypothetical protein ROR02_21470 [Pararhodospirillum oryzae]
MNDLLEEFATLATATTPDHDRALTRRGVPETWLKAPSAPARYGVGRGALTKEGWVFGPGHAHAFLPEPPLADIDSPEWPTPELFDLVVFRPDQPGRWWSKNESVLLNGSEVERATFFEDPLVIHPDPLEWMRAGGQGVVILDWGRFLPLHVGGPSRLVCTTLPLAERLDRALRAPPRRFQIEVIEEGVAA